jgi:hypothetical protein
VPGVGTPRSRSEERRQTEGVLDPLAEVIGVTPGSQADPPLSPKRKHPCRLYRRLVPRPS